MIFPRSLASHHFLPFGIPTTYFRSLWIRNKPILAYFQKTSPNLVFEMLLYMSRKEQTKV
jgi:hypothetical protein